MSENYDFEVTKWKSMIRSKEQGHVVTMMGSIVVRPPITVGPEFTKIIIGRADAITSLRYVFSNAEVSVFIAESCRSDATEEGRRQDIRALGKRIVYLANHPDEVLNIQYKDPFDTI
jgi:hypothetical protein